MSEILKMIEGKQLTKGQAQEILDHYDRMLAIAKRPVSNKCIWCGLEQPCHCGRNTNTVIEHALASMSIIMEQESGDNMEGENERNKR